MNLRRLAVLLHGMGAPLPAMVRALLSNTPPREQVLQVPASLILGTPAPGRARRFLSLSGNAHQRRVEFSLTWAQLAALRDLPKPLPERGYPLIADAVLIAKGLADVARGGIQITPEGLHLRTALAGLVPPQGYS